MHKAHIIAGCESGLDDISGPEAMEMAHWDRNIGAHLIHRRHYRNKTGMFVGLSHQLDVQDVRERTIYDHTLQLIIVDATIQRTPIRIVATHGPVSPNWQTKQAHYDAVLRNIDRIIQEDKTANAAERIEEIERMGIWMADHNLVRNRERDETRGMVGGIKNGEHKKLLRTVEHIEEKLGGIKDAFRIIRGEEAQDFTHGKRRIDWISTQESTPSEKGPWLAGMRHIPTHNLELASQKRNGEIEIHTPTHKAVEITLRFSDQKQTTAPWSYKGTRYPREIWKKTMDIMSRANNRKVAVTLETTGGNVKLRLRTQSAKSAFEGWQSEEALCLKILRKIERGRNRKR